MEDDLLRDIKLISQIVIMGVDISNPGMYCCIVIKAFNGYYSTGN